MKLLENMTYDELKVELKKNQTELEDIIGKIDHIHNVKDYSDELAKYFHLGKVGFRKDTKRQNRTVDRAVDRAVEATKLYEKRNSIQNRIESINKVVAYLEKNDKTLTKAQNVEKKIMRVQDIDWIREDGGYRHGVWFVKKVDDIVFAYKNGEIKFYRNTVKEVKKLVAIAVIQGL